MSELGLRQRSRLRRHLAIERAALQLFSERGYEMTTVAQVAEAAEVSPRTVSLYFPSKLHLALSYSTTAAERLAERLAGRRNHDSTLHVILEWLPDEFAAHGDVLALHRAMLETNPMLRGAETVELANAKYAVTVALAEDLGRSPDGVVAVVGGALEGILAVLNQLDPEADGTPAIPLVARMMEAVMDTARDQLATARKRAAGESRSAQSKAKTGGMG